MVAKLMQKEGLQTTISSIKDKLIPIITEWRSRALASIYLIIFLDAMLFKAREGNKVI
jgi:transposase-like protein